MSCSIGLAAPQEVLTRRCEEIDHLGMFAEPCLVLRTSRNDHNVAWATNPLFAAKPELHLALEHPHDLLIWVTVRRLIFSLICSSGKPANVPKPISVGI